MTHPLMLLDHFWIYIPMGVFVVSTIMQAFAAILFVNTPELAAVLYLWVLMFSLIVSSNQISRPFHAERLMAATTLTFLYLTLFGNYQRLLTQFANSFIDSSHFTSALRAVYSTVWLGYSSAMASAYLQNIGKQLPSSWPLGTMFMLTFAMIPLETSIFIGNQPPLLWAVRTALALPLFVLISFGDAVGNLYRTFRRASKLRRRKHVELQVTHRTIDIEPARTVYWTPIALWPYFVHPYALFVYIPYVFILGVGVHARWFCGAEAEALYLSGERVPSLGRLIEKLRSQKLIVSDPRRAYPLQQDAFHATDEGWNRSEGRAEVREVVVDCIDDDTDELADAASRARRHHRSRKKHHRREHRRRVRSKRHRKEEHRSRPASPIRSSRTENSNELDTSEEIEAPDQ